MGTPEVTPTLAATETVRAPAQRWRWFAPALVVAWIVGMIDKVGVGVIAANNGFLVSMHLVGKPAEVGLLTTVMLVFYGLFMPVWGILVDRYGARKCAIAGLTLWGLSTLLAAAASGVTVLLVSRAILGAAEGFLWPVSNALTARWFPLSERGRAKSVWINGINVGLAVSGFLVNGVIGLSGWRAVFLVLSGLALLICVPAAFFLIRDDPSEHPRISAAELAVIRGDKLDAGNTTLSRELRTGAYWLAVVAWTANNFGVFGLATWFPTYLEKNEGLSTGDASLFIALAFAGCIIAGPLVGWASDRMHRKAVWLLAGFVIAVVFLGLTRIGSGVPIQLTGVIGAIIGIEGFTTIAGQGVLHSIAPNERMGRAIGIMTGTANFIAAFSATIMGALIGAGGFGAAFIFLMGIFAIGAVAGLLLHRSRY
ncbi:MAG TPA: MFS transporter [Trebonia sp.]|jgi:ACS family glucarate transporter-like MFS transporter|nr:MFS transporter [Trebonia sp.]